MIAFLLGLAALPYLLVPIFIYRNQRFPAAARVRAQDSGFSPTSVKEALNAVEPELRKAGFLEPVEVVMSGMVPHMRAFIRIYRHSKENILAQSTALQPDESGSPVFKTFIELGSRYKDGQELLSHNSEFNGAPIEPPTKKTVMFSGVKDVQKLCLLHMKNLVKVKNVGAPDLPAAGEEEAFLRQLTKKSLAEQVRLGALILDSNQQLYRPSFAGAVLFGWYAMWPMSLLRKLAGNMRAKIMLRQLSSQAAG